MEVSAKKEGKKGLVLIFGATGYTGYHIAKAFLAANQEVRLVVRSLQKAKPLFAESEPEKVFQCDFHKTVAEFQSGNKNIWKEVFGPSQNFEKVNIVVDSLRSRLFDSAEAKFVYYDLQKFIIEQCLQYKIDKFVFVSAVGVTHEWHPVSMFLNFILPNCIHWKCLTENEIRKSGLNQMIVRAPWLKDGLISKTEAVIVGQGDPGRALAVSLTRATNARLIVEAVEDKNVPNKVTIECGTPWKIQGKEFTKGIFGSLKPDNEQSLCKANHQKTLKIVRTTLVLLLLSALIYFTKPFLIKFTKHYLK